MIASYPRIFRLKVAVMARYLSEALVYLLLVLLPAVLLAAGIFQQLPLYGQAAVSIGALIGLFLLPACCMVTWKVILVENGIQTVTLTRKTLILWEMVRKVSFKSGLLSRGYSLEYDGGTVDFPVWIENSKELVRLIKSRIAGHGIVMPPRMAFRQDVCGVIQQLFQVALGAGFIVLLALFLVGSLHDERVSSGDRVFLLLFTGALVLLIAARCLFILMMPLAVEIVPSGLLLRGLLFRKSLSWHAIQSVSQAPFFLPEGLLVRARGWMCIIGDGMDGFDELEDAFNHHMQQRLNQKDN